MSVCVCVCVCWYERRCHELVDMVSVKVVDFRIVTL